MASGAPRGLLPDDILHLKSIDDVQLSPDGKLVVFVVRSIDTSKDEYRSTIWLVPAHGRSEPVQLTRGPKIDRAPRWSHDGHTLAFLSDRDGGRSQIYLLPIAGGEARKLTALPAGAGEPLWSPDGTQLLFAAPVVVEPPPKERDAFERWRQRPKVIDRIPYKFDGVGFLLQAHLQLFIVSVDSGQVRRITTDDRTHWQPAWSPDGRRIVYASSRRAPAESHRFDIWTMDADGHNARAITDAIEFAQWPSWSPDGRLIAFYGARQTADPMTLVWAVSPDGGVPRALTEEFDREVPLLPGFAIPAPMWSSDGRTLLFTVADRGEVHLARCSVADGKVRKILAGDRWVLVPSVSRTGDIAYVASSPAVPGDVYACAADGSDERRLTRLNDALLSEVAVPRVERRTFATPHGGHVDGVLIRIGATSGPVPLLVDIHGGPQGFVGSGFPTWEPYRYVLAARGWAILALNPRGSGSYGREFAHSLRGRWGEHDFPEQMAAIDALVADGIADPDRLAVTGYSYGGYMTAWMITHSDRFKAAVIGAPTVNQESDIVADVGVIMRGWNFGDYFRDRDVYRRVSPIQAVDRVTTPTLLLHGEADDRCPLSQSEEFFTGLLIAGRVPAQLVTYPGGSHGFVERGRPSHRVDFHRRLVEWIERWTVHGGESRSARRPATSP